MKKLTSLILVCVMLTAVFASCGTHEAAKALDSLLITIENGDFANSEVLADSPFANEDDEMMKAMYKNFSYKIGEVTESEDGTAVAVKITMTDIGTVFTNYMSEALENAMNPDWDKDETRFNEMLTESSAPTKDFDISVNMVNENGKWTVSEDNEAFIDALTGGLFSSLSGLLE